MTIEEARQFIQLEADWDWEKFRRETAKDILAGWYGNPDSNDRSFEQMARMAIEQADELIEQLRKDEK